MSYSAWIVKFAIAAFGLRITKSGDRFVKPSATTSTETRRWQAHYGALIDTAHDAILTRLDAAVGT